ncbi:hypothetical protein LSAT2_011673 [Lamellibrachia satsuma]|nr:hypothetical protein LSAT2_011673 [Lamellibrachia satsuma]
MVRCTGRGYEYQRRSKTGVCRRSAYNRGRPNTDGHHRGRPNTNGHRCGRPNTDGHRRGRPNIDGHRRGRPNTDGRRGGVMPTTSLPDIVKCHTKYQNEQNKTDNRQRRRKQRQTRLAKVVGYAAWMLLCPLMVLLLCISAPPVDEDDNYITALEPWHCGRRNSPKTT